MIPSACSLTANAGERENEMELLLLLILTLTPVPAPPAQATSCSQAIEDSMSHGGPRCAMDKGATRVTAASQPRLEFKPDALPKLEHKEEPRGDGILREHQAGLPVGEICRRHGISDATFYTWRSKYGGLEVSEAKRLKALEEENRKLKKLPRPARACAPPAACHDRQGCHPARPPAPGWSS